MNVRCHVWGALLGGMLLVPALGGCAAEKPSPETTKPSTQTFPSASRLVDAAWLTYRNSRAAPDLGGIPPECWAEDIKALHPIKVYTHRVNVVVVQRVHEGIEEGKYIYIPISSYLPQPGDDGFEFTPNPLRNHRYYLGEGVFDFKRTIRQP